MDKVFIILCDTLRAKSLPHYGNENNTIPNLLQTIDEDFIVCSRAYTPSPWTIPSHLSLFTGLYPSEAMETPSSLQLNTQFKTLPVIFKDAGYKTFGLSTNELVSKFFGFDAGFDLFLQLWLPDPEQEDMFFDLNADNDFERTCRLLKLVVNERDKARFFKGLRQKIYKRFNNILKNAAPSSNKAMELLKRYVSENHDEKLFCFVNLMQAHEKYNPPRLTRKRLIKYNREYEKYYKTISQFDHYAVEPFSENFLEYLKQLYEEEVLYLDLVISDFIRFLKANELYDKSTIIITSDHGEHFGENGHFAHVFSVYEPVIRIPMYIKWPGETLNINKVDNNMFMLNDLYSTFITRLDSLYPSLQSSVDMNSTRKREWIISQWPDLSSHIKGFRKKRKSFSIQEIGLDEGGLTAYILDNGIKAIENGNKVLFYDLNNDPDEKDPCAVSEENRKKVGRIRNILIQ